MVYAAANFLKGDMEVIHWDQADQLDKDKVFILDVRVPEEVSNRKYVYLVSDRVAESVKEENKDKKPPLVWTI